MACFSLFFLLVLWFSLSRGVATETSQEREALLSFISQVPHENRLQWNASDSACNWVGVLCDPDRTHVVDLRLPGVGLLGPIPAGTLGRLSELRVLSLRSNRISGGLPDDFSNLTLLRSLYLQNNDFAGEFPNSLTELTQLTRLDLSFNKFAGKLPAAVGNLTNLTGLFLQNNSFFGGIPDINIPSLLSFNVSNNNLNGSVPESLTRFPVSSFAGNINLCGDPLSPCNPFSPSPPSPSPSPPSILPPNPVSKKFKKLSNAAIIGISTAGGGILLLLLFLFISLCCFRRGKQKPAKPPKSVSGAAPGEMITSSSKEEMSPVGEKNKLVLLDGGVYRFDLEDLLRASAEILGKGSGGTSYKAVLEDGTTVVVKRLKEVEAGRKEFEMHMEVLGRVKQENLVKLRAFYYSKDEKLIVSDFMAGGSLSSILHGSKGSGRTPLDWNHRKKIAVAAGRAISHLHVSARLVHGNLKSSNVLLRPDPNPVHACLSDFGLHSLFAHDTPPNRVAGYLAPEVREIRMPTFSSDVYSFGVLLLELLTGREPNQGSVGEDGDDLPRWVESVVREQSTAEVFDEELIREEDVEEEMVRLLQIAIACVATAPAQRPHIQEVLRMIEEVN